VSIESLGIEVKEYYDLGFGGEGVKLDMRVIKSHCRLKASRMRRR